MVTLSRFTEAWPTKLFRLIQHFDLRPASYAKGDPSQIGRIAFLQCSLREARRSGVVAPPRPLAE